MNIPSGVLQCDSFIGRFAPPVAGASTGCLVGLRVLIEDSFDIAKMVTGGGNPEWAATHAPAEKNATVFSALLDQGATIVGKTHMDEFAYSLMGQNARYGTPINPAAPHRMLTVTPSELEQYRNAALTLLSIAGHAGLPQIALPVANIDGAPIGLSLVGAKGSDADLLKLANTIIENAAGNVT